MQSRGRRKEWAKADRAANETGANRPSNAANSPASEPVETSPPSSSEFGAERQFKFHFKNFDFKLNLTIYKIKLSFYILIILIPLKTSFHKI